jgi:hypothetical protein
LVAKVQKQTRHHQSHIREVTKDAQGASLVETLSECSSAWQTGQAQTRIYLPPHAGMSVVDYMQSGFLKYSSTMKHWFVDDDSDHALMRITVPGHLKTRTAG